MRDFFCLSFDFGFENNINTSSLSELEYFHQYFNTIHIILEICQSAPRFADKISSTREIYRREESS